MDTPTVCEHEWKDNSEFFESVWEFRCTKCGETKRRHSLNAEELKLVQGSK
jgi:hypothetical protein